MQLMNMKIKNERNILLGELNNINNTNYEVLFKAIEYHYYSKGYVTIKLKLKMIKKQLNLLKNFNFL